MKDSFEFITKEAQKPYARWSISQLLLFHAFNPNGVVQAKRRNDDRIRVLVDSKVIPSGWHLAYGSFDDHYVESIYALLKKDRPGKFHAHSIIHCLQERITLVSAKIAEVSKSQ